MITPRIIAETADFFVIDKPHGMATEPPSSHLTLRDWVIQEKHIKPEEWGSDDRFGIVHRLDADTSGVLVWAKTPASQEKLRELWQGRAVKKTYLALVTGTTEPNGSIEYALERDNQNDRQRIAHLPTAKSRPALTHYKTVAHGTVGEWAVSLLELHPITGRTHQIRVHCKAIGHPLIADKLYGEKASHDIAHHLGLGRQFLHAASIELPGIQSYSAPLPRDLEAALTAANIKWPPTSDDS